MSAKIKTAMLLAAGYGTRLKPLTDHTPKPLVPVAGRPMIEYALDKLQRYGIEKIVVNVSHHKQQLIDYLSAMKNLDAKISEEPEPLETGGGLKKAGPFFSNQPAFVINSDIIWSDKDQSAFERLAQNWDGDKMDFLLLAQSKATAVGHDKGEDHLFIKPENTIGWDDRNAPYIIAGIYIFHPRVLRDALDGKFSVKVLWLRALAQKRLFCLPHNGSWFQTGTVADIEIAEKSGLSKLCA
ncbi:MAG TPA: nucleotidyltransferase family protein [Verrucomicrobiae bacterium]|nr:nucleotidyltransferase family protein [Verrucomicrobiae bacterium]